MKRLAADEMVHYVLAKVRQKVVRNNRIKVSRMGSFGKFTRMALYCSILALEMGSAAGSDKLGPQEAIVNNHLRQDLHKRFPMCEEFMDVDWIDTRKSIGYSRNLSTVPRQHAYPVGTQTLIYLHDDWPSVTYDIGRWKSPAHKKNLRKLISKYGISIYPGEYRAAIKGPNVEIVLNDTPFRTTSSRQVTLCVPYPGYSRMLVIEKNAIKSNDSDNWQPTLQELARWLSEIPISSLSIMISHARRLDVNFDGKLDFITGSTIIYSSGNRYYSSVKAWISEGDPGFGIFHFPPRREECQIALWRLYVTTDGQRYYLNNKCDLTELTGVLQNNGQD